MYALLLGLGALGLFLWGRRAFVNANPQTLAHNIRLGGGVLAVIAGAGLTLLGRGAFGLPLILLGIGLLKRVGGWRFAGRTSRKPGGTSRVRTGMLEMELDLDSGAMRGRVLAGELAGRELDQLTRDQLIGLMRGLVHAEPQAASLLEAYLDRRMPGWREDLQGDPGPRSHDTAGQGPMTQEEAYQILGLDPGAGTADIRRAHRELMKKLHPDQGGSNYLASRVNQAKDVLTRTQR
ncbi:DnaJ domain-containing protein [Terrihabitans sp. B22-R8]|uniref:DnaJ domain-containing protein n=1 Tax=Terrihabitans sp. B22-R8 TaxID=3425128 RepID=UPI00403D2105